jgi:hypothetical protein
MNIETTAQAPTTQWRMWVVFGVSVIAAGATGAVLALALDNGTRTQTVSAPSAGSPTSAAAPDIRSLPSIMSLTPARLAAAAKRISTKAHRPDFSGALIPPARVPKRNRANNAPTLAAVLASMTPETRRYTQKVTSLTFAQLASGAAGSP